MSSVTDQVGLDMMFERAASGDEVAFARIVKAHHDDMARICFVISGDVDLAQDAVQAAWPIAWRSLRTLRDQTRLRPWLMKIAANEARQLIRRRGRRRLIEISVDPASGIGQGAGDPAERAAEIDLSNALSRLNLKDRTILGMRYAAGLSSSEIGQAIGMTGGGVRARIARLLDRLREEL